MMKKKWDILFFFQILAIGTTSLLIIYSINRSLAASQLVFWIIGFAALLICANIKAEFWKIISGRFFLFALFLLIVLSFLGDPVRGAVRWVDLGPLRIQPSELAKIAFILFLAKFYETRSAAKITNLVTSIAIAIPVIFLVLIEPDIGSTLVFVAIWFGISYAANLKIKDFAIFALILIVFSFFAYEFLAPYQKERVVSFLNPNFDPLGTGYNIIQSKITIGSGEFFGRGFGQGSQSQLNFLPESESDFIFASISEQLGFLGASLLITIYFWMILKIIRVIQEANKYGQLAVSGVISLFITQFTINIGMNLGLLPVTGITLPLVSYGGSSLITTLVLIGIVISIKNSAPG